MLPPTTTTGRLFLLGTLFLSGTTALAQQQAPAHQASVAAQEMHHNPLGRLFHGIAASPKPNKAARPNAPADPVQSSYDTSTAVDPSTWSHIADPTYGGLRGPPPQQQQPQLQVSSVSGGGRQEFVIVNHNTNADPVQTSYDTSTAADPTGWRHISDPTYGGMTAPGPAQTQMVAKRADSSSTSSSSSSKSGNKDSKSTTTETTSRSGTTETATRTDTHSASGSSSASSSSSSGAAAPGVVVPWVFAVLLRFL